MTSTSTNPSSGASGAIGFAETSAHEHNEIVQRAAQAGPGWAATPGPVRAAALRRIADALAHASRDLVAIADDETGLGTPRLTSEVARTTTQLRVFAEVIAHGAHLAHAGVTIPGDTGTPPGGPDLHRYHLPLGTVAVFAASNFPFAFSVAGGDTASALAAGCPVIVKAHPAHPQLSLLTARIIDDALSEVGVDPGVFALVSGIDEGIRLVSDPMVRAAAFTGSFAGGRALAGVAASRPDPIPFYGEFGSVNPVFVLPDAITDVHSFIGDYLDSLTLGGGQFCTNPGLLIAPRRVNLSAAIAEQILARPAAALLHRGIQSEFVAGVEQLKGRSGVAIYESTASLPASGFHVRPVVFSLSADMALQNRSLIDREYFGPAGLLVEYDDDDQLMALCCTLQGCLVSSIHGRDDCALLRHVIRVAARISGRVVWNSWPTGVAVVTGQHHGGPFPATSNPLFTSVGPDAIMRFLRPVAFQGLPPALVPAEVQR